MQYFCIEDSDSFRMTGSTQQTRMRVGRAFVSSMNGVIDKIRTKDNIKRAKGDFFSFKDLNQHDC